MISSGPFRGLFLFLGTAEFLHLIATRGASPQGPKKRLEFCEISHERGARSPANAPRDWTPPTHGTPPGGRRRGSTGRAGLPGHTPGGAATPEWCGGTAAPGRGGLPRRRRAPCTGHVRGGYPRRLPARAGRLPGKTGRFPGRTARLAGRATGRGGYPGGIYRLCRGGYRAGRGRAAGYPRGGAAAQLPPGGRYPRRLPPAQLAELCSEL